MIERGNDFKREKQAANFIAFSAANTINFKSKSDAREIP